MVLLWKKEYFFSLDIYNLGGIYNGKERGSNLLNNYEFLRLISIYVKL